MRQDRSPICAAGRFPHSGRPAVAGFAQLAAPPILAAQQAVPICTAGRFPPSLRFCCWRKPCVRFIPWPGVPAAPALRAGRPGFFFPRWFHFEFLPNSSHNSKLATVASKWASHNNS